MSEPQALMFYVPYNHEHSKLHLVVGWKNVYCKSIKELEVSNLIPPQLSLKARIPLLKVANIMGKGENTGHNHFLFFTLLFSKAFFIRFI